MTSSGPIQLLILLYLMACCDMVWYKCCISVACIILMCALFCLYSMLYVLVCLRITECVCSLSRCSSCFVVECYGIVLCFQSVCVFRCFLQMSVLCCCMREAISDYCFYFWCLCRLCIFVVRVVDDVVRSISTRVL